MARMTFYSFVILTIGSATFADDTNTSQRHDTPAKHSLVDHLDDLDSVTSTLSE